MARWLVPPLIIVKCVIRYKNLPPTGTLLSATASESRHAGRDAGIQSQGREILKYHPLSLKLS